MKAAQERRIAIEKLKAEAFNMEKEKQTADAEAKHKAML